MMYHELSERMRLHNHLCLNITSHSHNADVRSQLTDVFDELLYQHPTTTDD
jgi:hypothetical protein